MVRGVGNCRMAAAAGAVDNDAMPDGVPALLLSAGDANTAAAHDNRDDPNRLSALPLLPGPSPLAADAAAEAALPCGVCGAVSGESNGALSALVTSALSFSDASTASTSPASGPPAAPSSSSSAEIAERSSAPARLFDESTSCA